MVHLKRINQIGFWWINALLPLIKVYIMRLALLLFVFFIFSCSRDFRKDSFTVSKVENGNTLVLQNGFKVSLLGVSNTVEGERFLREKVLKKNVRFKFDKASPKILISKRDKKKQLFTKMTAGLLNLT